MAGLFDDPLNPIQRSILARALASNTLGAGATILGSAGPVKKRNAFFSFHYADIMRVNNVRKSWEFIEKDSTASLGFYDQSLWESKKRTSEQALKDLIRDGVQNTSAVCVLVGAETAIRPWVRYEIARAVIDGRGLLAVHINGLKHHNDRLPHPNGPNPLAAMGITKVQPNLLNPPKYYLCELNQNSWVLYGKHTNSVDLPPYLRQMDPAVGMVISLSAGATLHDYASQDGHTNIGSWIDAAARQVGR